MRPKLPAGARAPVLGRQEVMEVVRVGLGEEVRLRWSKLMAEAERLMPPRNAAVIDLCVLYIYICICVCLCVYIYI